jgi:hypothetical protein
MNDLDLFAYLRHVLTHLPEHRIFRIDEMLPWNRVTALETEATERR